VHLASEPSRQIPRFFLGFTTHFLESPLGSLVPGPNIGFENELTALHGEVRYRA
jgi:hypothetical protein